MDFSIEINFHNSLENDANKVNSRFLELEI